MTAEQPEAGRAVEPAYAAAMPAPQGGALPTGLEWQALERMAHTLADSDVIPYRLKRKPADVAVVLLAAREYGIPPLMALSKLPVVNGTPAPMGELMVALVLRAGHSIRAKLEGEGGPVDELVGVCTTKRRDEDEPDELRFTFREAVTAGLVELRDGKPYARDNKGNPTPWELYTGNMLRWRAVANACRLRFPDVLLGLSYLPEELGAVVDAEGAPIVGEVVHRTAPAASLEQRTAQDTATRLAEFTGPPEVLDNVLAHAEANGYADAVVDYAGERVPLRTAIATAKANAADRVIDQPAGQPAPAAQPAQEAPAAPSAPEEPTEAPSAPQEPAQAAPTQPAPTHADDLVSFAATVDDVDVIRDLYRENKAELDVEVAAPAELGIGERVKLGAVLMGIAQRLAAGAGPLERLGPPDEPDSAGWPEQSNDPPP